MTDVGAESVTTAVSLSPSERGRMMGEHFVPISRRGTHMFVRCRTAFPLMIVRCRTAFSLVLVQSTSSLVSVVSLVSVLLLGDATASCSSIRVGDYLEAESTKQHELLFDADDVTVRQLRR